MVVVETLNDLFPLRQADQYYLRGSSQFITLNVKTAHHSFESVTYLWSKIWETIPSHFKEIDSLKNFKNAIKKWKLELRPCRICKTYIQNIGYV